MVDLIIQGGTIVSDGVEIAADLYIRDGKVAGHGRDLPVEAASVLDAAGCLVLPGLVDIDSLPDQTVAGADALPAELMNHAGQMAVLGGFTTVCHDVPSLDPLDGFRTALAASSRPDYVFRSFATRPGDTARRKAVEACRAGDAAASRASLRRQPPLAEPFPDDEAMRLLREAGSHRPVFFNPQSGPLGDLAAETASRSGGAAHEQRRAANPDYLGRAGLLAIGSLLEHVRANAAALPVSSESEAKTLLDLRERLGLSLMAATNVAYLLFHSPDDGAPQNGRMAAGYPPPRRKSDSVALWKAIEAGLIDAIGTGCSAPDDALFGNPIFALPALYAHGVLANRVSMPTLVSALCDNPAKMLSLYPRKGTLQVGADADIVLFETDGSTSAPEGSPFAELTMAGRVRAVLRRGEFAAIDGQVQCDAGSGVELKPESTEVSK